MRAAVHIRLYSTDHQNKVVIREQGGVVGKELSDSLALSADFVFRPESASFDSKQSNFT